MLSAREGQREPELDGGMPFCGRDANRIFETGQAGGVVRWAAWPEGTDGIATSRLLRGNVNFVYKRHFGLAHGTCVNQTPCNPGREPKPMLSIPPSVFAGDSSLQPLGLATPELAVQVMPALGAKVLSLVDRTFGTEWMRTPPDCRGVFRNAITDPFAQSTLAGADERFPTVAACEWKGRPTRSTSRRPGIDVSASWPERRSRGAFRCFLKTYETPE